MAGDLFSSRSGGRAGFAALALALAAAAFGPGTASAAPAPDFTLTVDGRAVQGAVGAAFVMPGERLRLRASSVPEGGELLLQTSGQGVVDDANAPEWQWQAPQQTGLYPLVVHNRDPNNAEQSSEIRLNVFVKKPLAVGQTQIDGYRIGNYQRRALRGRAIYEYPAGLVEVTEANRGVQVSPHFKLGDFLCHQQPGHWPKYLLVRPKLLQKLEALRAKLIEAGVAEPEITVMSAYRTPWYNADIGNTTVYSRHLYGGAADIFVDADSDGVMDDLNADGAIGRHDARWLADLVQAVAADDPALVGGLSTYPPNSVRGPFVHMDVRGVAARW